MVRHRSHARLVGLALLLSAGAASADPPPKKAAPAAEPRAPAPAPAEKEGAAKQAMALNDEAWALYEKGRYRAAIEKLEEAVRLDPNGKDLVYNLALIHEKLARFDEAATHYKRYLEMESDPKAKARVQGVLKRMEGAQREREERAPTPAPAPARDALPPSPPPRPVKPWVIATGSVAGGAALIGSIFGLSAVARNPGSGARTGDGTSIDDLQRDARVAHTNAVVADVAFVVAAAAAATAIVLYFTTPRPPASTGAQRFQIATSPGFPRVTW